MIILSLYLSYQELVVYCKIYDYRFFDVMDKLGVLPHYVCLKLDTFKYYTDSPPKSHPIVIPLIQLHVIHQKHNLSFHKHNILPSPCGLIITTSLIHPSHHPLCTYIPSSFYFHNNVFDRPM